MARTLTTGTRCDSTYGSKIPLPGNERTGSRSEQKCPEMVLNLAGCFWLLNQMFVREDEITPRHAQFAHVAGQVHTDFSQMLGFP